MDKRALPLAVLVAFLCAPAAHAAEWRVPADFATIQAAIDSPDAQAGDTIFVAPGNHAGAFITKQVEIKGEDGAVIDSGPLHGSGMVMGFRFLAGSGGATISHLTFQVDLAIMNGDGVNDVTVSHNVFLNAVQGVSNWRGSGWNISNNQFIDLRTRNGGGIAVLVGHFTGTGVIQDNVVAHNKISGTLTCGPGEFGGYNGTGIVLYSDYRWGRLGGEIAYNRVIKNKIALASTCPDLVDVAGIELTVASDADASPVVIHDNAIGFNDLRETTLQIDLTPEALDNPTNAISRNLGENRGHGLHPSVFGPH